MEFSLVVAHDSERGIGRDGRIPWQIRGDMQRFRELTLKSGFTNVVIMGRGTWESLPKKHLEKRINLVVSRTLPKATPQITVCGSLEEAISFSEGIGKFSKLNVSAIGGVSIYAAAMNDLRFQRIYVTEVDGKFNCDKFLSEIPKDYELESRGRWVDECGIKFRYLTYERRK